ncbi:MAG: carboxylating nicotinate-nucleotide diphosphorylase [Chitinophagales bacterium]
MNLHDFIDQIIREDIGEGIGKGDHTSLSCIPDTATDTARLIVKGDGVLAGVELAELIFKQIDADLSLDIFIKDGEKVKKGDIAFTVTGKTQSILQAERLVLNCMQRMSGIATMTNKFVELVADTNAKVLDTRKTTPCFRYIEKWAVRIGGGHNHRMGLYDMIMIKDNHHDFCGGITNAILTTRKYLNDKGLDIKVEIEVRNLEELNEVLAVGQVDRIMLDNFDVPTTKKAVEIVNKRFETESSGGITLDTIRGYSETGVDYISVGALTHSYKSLDLSLKAV